MKKERVDAVAVLTADGSVWGWRTGEEEARRLEGAGAAALAAAWGGGAGGGKRVRRVVVLDGGAWTQEIELSPMQVQGLDEAALGNVLGYEAEAFSGQGAETAELLWRQEGTRDGYGVYRVAQIDRARTASLRAELKRAGFELAGVGHPVFLGAEGADAAAAWNAAGGAEGAVPVPLAGRPAGRGEGEKCARLAAALALAALVLCGGWEAARRSVRASLRAEVDELEALDARNRREQAAARRARDDAARVNGRRKAEVDAAVAQGRGRKAWGRMLAALAEGCPAGTMVEGVSCAEDYRAEVTAVCGSLEGAEGYLKALRERLGENGMQARLREVRSLNRRAGGGPWRVKLELGPVAGEEWP